MNSLSDIYIFLPCCFKESADIEDLPSPALTEEAKKFLEIMHATSAYECAGELSGELHRRFLGTFYFACCDDDYEDVLPEILPDSRRFAAVRASFYLTLHPAAGLSTLLIALPQSAYDSTQIADQISVEYLYISREENGSYELLTDFIAKAFSLIRLDAPKAVFSLPEKPQPLQKMECMLAGTAYNSRHVHYQVHSSSITEAASDNIAQFDFYEAYVSSRFLIYVLKTFTENYLDNMEDEAAMLFICELILFQNGAITRTNRKIVKELTSPTRISLKTIEEMNTEFGKTIEFWNLGNFQYAPVQLLSERISQAFGTTELLERYSRNREHLEHIVDLKGSQSAEREGKIINFIAIFLAVIQIIPLVLEWGGYLSDSPRLLQTLGGLSIALFLFVLAWFLRRRNRKRRRIS